MLTILSTLILITLSVLAFRLTSKEEKKRRAEIIRLTKKLG